MGGSCSAGSAWLSVVSAGASNFLRGAAFRLRGSFGLSSLYGRFCRCVFVLEAHGLQRARGLAD